MLKIFLSNVKNPKKLSRQISYTLTVILLPVAISLMIYHNYHEVPHPVKVAVLQPNIDPYNEKFNSMSSEEQISKMLKLAEDITDSSTEYVVGPETSLPVSIWEDQLQNHRDIRMLKTFLAHHPGVQMVTGVATNKQYGTTPPTITARKFPDSEDYYDSYNTAMQLDATGKIQLYHKSQLVIGVEKIPYPKVFGYFEKFAIDLGGASGSLGTEKEPVVFNSPKNIKVAPAICYESIYGSYMREYILKGAQLIFIITNDGWWNDSPGYRQHLQYARLRAIETRRSIARSANTGISAFINQRGDLMAQTNWWEATAIKQTINANDAITFYANHGDYLGVISSAISVVILVLNIFFRFAIKNKV
jgi:apolipoprotein N-acyltransferase